jgi:hypothetical protein
MEKLLSAWRIHIDTSADRAGTIFSSPFKTEHAMKRMSYQIDPIFLRNQVESYFKNANYATEGRTQGSHKGADINLYEINPVTGMYYTEHDIKVFASHEIGHTFRSFNGESDITRKLLGCVEPSCLVVPEDYLDWKIQDHNENKKIFQTDFLKR